MERYPAFEFDGLVFPQDRLGLLGGGPDAGVSQKGLARRHQPLADVVHFGF